MESFNEYLDNFLTGCRENALQELKSDGRYAEMKSNQNDLRSKIELLISPETQKLLETYFEIASGVQSMEANKILLCGFTLSAAIHKRCDTSTPEYKAFAEKYL